MAQPKLEARQTASALQLAGPIKRDWLVNQKLSEKHPLEAAPDPDSIRSIKQFSKALDKAIERIATNIIKLIATKP